MRIFALTIFAIITLASCSVTKQLEKSAKKNVLQSEALQTAHVGISVFEPVTGKYWFNHQGDKYFVPASNAKIPTCYAAMKYLGDSLVGLRYSTSHGSRNIVVQPAGDPTFLHPGFGRQPVLNFFKRDTTAIFMAIDNNWKEESLGSGWSWNDYVQEYMAERSVFPIYGNVIRFFGREGRLSIIPRTINIDYGGTADDIESLNLNSNEYTFTRQRHRNTFLWDYSSRTIDLLEIPFITSLSNSLQFLKDTIKGLRISHYRELQLWEAKKIHSQPTDSLLKPMMHHSDNFFAEQSLLMVSNEHLGVMNDAKIIDTLLKTDFANLPQKPRWAEGSGLSRYNLFTPQDFVFILNKMKNEFGMARIKEIFPTGGEGTLSSYYKKDSTFIYAKTGTLSGVVALSGFLYTKDGKELIFSVLVNNHQGSATNVRRAVEKFIQGIRENF
ncbi:MAG TPA: D-alanyl-D-alanine carboxypeptidase [Flavisolibacter sp.]|jgi:D-alanyl-D-alanine carboxypeptidase/D-alanyl-D-alanine-endopeptidase (penicillin-binding protein 4)